jgi:hypothetical protein
MDLMIAYFNLAPIITLKLMLKTHDWKIIKKIIINIFYRQIQKGVTEWNSNTDQIIRCYIPTIFKYINDISGYAAIQFDPNNLLVKDEMSNLYKFAVKDKDLQKQKQKRGGFRKKNSNRWNIYIITFIVNNITHSNNYSKWDFRTI